MAAVYRRFGRDGLKQYPLADVQLLLSSKQLALEAGRGRNLSDQQAEVARLLTLEVQDLTGYVQAQLAGLHRPLGLGQFRAGQQPQHPRQRHRPRDRGIER